MNNFMWLTGVIFSLPVFIFLGSLLLKALKTPDQQKFSVKKRNTERQIVLKTRRRIESSPNIVCLFPIRQTPRNDAPLP